MKDVLKMVCALWIICGVINLGGVPWELKNHPIPNIASAADKVKATTVYCVTAFVLGPIWLGAELKQHS